jgi:nucleoside-diphosphate-sugar epimerase
MLDGLGSRPYVHTGGLWVYGNTDGVVDETAAQSPPAITAWRGDNERRILGRAGGGGHPVLVMPGVVYGHGGGLIGRFIGAPARAGTAHYIGAGDNRWAVVHVDDIADLYVAALAAPAGGVYAGVDDTQAPTMRQIAEAVSAAAGQPDTASSITMEHARREFGPLADAFALDQRIAAAGARRDLGWAPASRNVLAELATEG